MDYFLQELIPRTTVWLLSSGVKIVGILIGAYIFHKIAQRAIDKVVRKAVIRDRFMSEDAEVKRENTLIRVFHSVLHVLVITIVVMMILTELGIEIGPIIAAAGIAGLAFGFGAQYLIRDIIAGLFITVENQYRVGDVACLDDTCGLVENITLRMTILRDLDGKVHHVPNGEIKRSTNLSKQFARVNLNIGIGYDSDLEKVIEVINRVGNEIAEDPNWKEFIIKPPQFLRVDDFADSAIIVKILGDTIPLKQWDVSGEFRKRIKIAFDKEGIEIPYPQRVVHQAKN